MGIRKRPTYDTWYKNYRQKNRATLIKRMKEYRQKVMIEVKSQAAAEFIFGY